MNGPFDKTAGIKQGYLFEFAYDAAKVIREIYNKPFPEPIERYFKDITITDLPEDNSVIELLAKKQQVILYGPPGTGKTYQSKHIALRLLQ